MQIALGIFAYNEEAAIGNTMASLSEQTLLTDPAHHCTIHVLPNGCRDRTAEVAREALEKWIPGRPQVAFQINEIAQGGKANAWNEFVHHFAASDTDLYIFLDADIRFGQPECLSRVVSELTAHPEAVVAVDLPLKDIADKANPNLTERVSLAASRLQTAGPPKIAGSLYVARGEPIRATWLPLGIIVEDGFVKAMLLTEGFTREERPEAIVRAEGATHYFEALTRFGDWFQHERRLVNGTAVNILLFQELRQCVARGENAGEVIRQRNTADPQWVSALAKRHRGALPGASSFIRAPLQQAWGAPGAKRLLRLGPALLRSTLNLAVAAVCQRDLAAGRLRW